MGNAIQLEQAQLEQAQLEQAQLEQAQLEQAQLEQAQLERAQLERAQLERARFNMVEQQIKPWNVSNSRVLDALRNIRREDFVPPAYQQMAFIDRAIPLAEGAMLEPKIVARMLQSLDPGDSDRVLVVGVGTGYVAALLSQCARTVICVEPDAAIIASATRRLAMAGISNVQFAQGDAAEAWPACGAIERILIRGSLAAAPSGLCRQLAAGGRCVAVVGTGEIMELICYSRENGAIVSNSILDTLTPRLGETQTTAQFVF